MNILSNLLNHSRNDLNVSVASELKKNQTKKKAHDKKDERKTYFLRCFDFLWHHKKAGMSLFCFIAGEL